VFSADLFRFVQHLAQPETMCEVSGMNAKTMRRCGGMTPETWSTAIPQPLARTLMPSLDATLPPPTKSTGSNVGTQPRVTARATPRGTPRRHLSTQSLGDSTALRTVPVPHDSACRPPSNIPTPRLHTPRLHTPRLRTPRMSTPRPSFARAASGPMQGPLSAHAEVVSLEEWHDVSTAESQKRAAMVEEPEETVEDSVQRAIDGLRTLLQPNAVQSEQNLENQSCSLLSSPNLCYSTELEDDLSRRLCERAVEVAVLKREADDAEGVRKAQEQELSRCRQEMLALEAQVAKLQQSSGLGAAWQGRVPEKHMGDEELGTGTLDRKTHDNDSHSPRKEGTTVFRPRADTGGPPSPNTMEMMEEGRAREMSSTVLEPESVSNFGVACLAVCDDKLCQLARRLSSNAEDRRACFAYLAALHVWALFACVAVILPGWLH